MAGLFDELRVLLHGIWNRRWIALAVAWGVAMLGWLGVALIPNSYQSKARVYVNTQSLLEDRMGITQVQSQQDLDRLRSTLASAENLEKVVRGTDLSQTVSGQRDIAANPVVAARHAQRNNGDPAPQPCHQAGDTGRQQQRRQQQHRQYRCQAIKQNVEKQGTQIQHKGDHRRISPAPQFPETDRRQMTGFPRDCTTTHRPDR